MTRKIRQRDSGFTLVEVLIVVAIISILVAVALPQYHKFTMKSKRSEAYMVAQMVHKFQMAHFAGSDEFFNVCPPSSLKNCFVQTGTASDALVIQTNQAMGLGTNLNKTKFGYKFLHWTRRNFPSDPWLNYVLSLSNNELDTDSTPDVIVIHFDFPGIIVPAGTPNGLPTIIIDDIKN